MNANWYVSGERKNVTRELVEKLSVATLELPMIDRIVATAETLANLIYEQALIVATSADPEALPGTEAFSRVATVAGNVAYTGMFAIVNARIEQSDSYKAAVAMAEREAEGVKPNQ